MQSPIHAPAQDPAALDPEFLRYLNTMASTEPSEPSQPERLTFHQICRGICRLFLIASSVLTFSLLARTFPQLQPFYAITGFGLSGFSIWKIFFKQEVDFFLYILATLTGLVAGWWDFFQSLLNYSEGRQILLQVGLISGVLLTTLIIAVAALRPGSQS